MSARHRHHKRFAREIESELAANAADQDAIVHTMACLARHGHHDTLTLQIVLDMLARDREALLVIISVLAPNEWRWRVTEQWRNEEVGV